MAFAAKIGLGSPRSGLFGLIEKEETSGAFAPAASSAGRISDGDGAAEGGWPGGEKAMWESLIGFKRAGSF